ncbi:MAG: hypothetical protein SwBeaBPW_04580 [Shewanella algae]
MVVILPPLYEYFTQFPLLSSILLTNIKIVNLFTKIPGEEVGSGKVGGGQGLYIPQG